MAGTRLICPHCTATLKTSKTLPVGKQVTCIQCKQRFAFALEMVASGTGDTHNDTAFSLAETQAGTLKSPIAGMAPLLPADEAPAKASEERAPAHSAGPRGALISCPNERNRGRQNSLAAVAAFVLITLLLLIAGGVGIISYLFVLSHEGASAQPIAEIEKPANPVKTPQAALAKVEPQKKVVVGGEKPAKKVFPVVAVAPAAKADDNLQEKIDLATRKGVRFLTQSIKPSGTWKNEAELNAAGYAALPGLAMLECGVSPKDLAVQQAAVFVRSQAAKLNETYDLGTAILFLDRLGDPSDKMLIRNLAVRLIAGQTSGGGWTYKCPVLNADEEEKLVAYLKNNKPEIKLLIPLQNMLAAPNVPGRERPRGDEPAKNSIKLVGNTEPREDAKEAAKTPKAAQDALPPKLRKLPIIVHQLKKLGFLEGSADDNSNTHFALLGLWAARRHGVPVELSLGLAAERFQKTQATDGGWGYVVRSPPKNTMTCVGLMGLAMGHGSAAEMFADAEAKNKVPVKTLAKDPVIDDALKALGQYVDGDKSLRGLEARIDLYYLWSLERVGMLYRQKEFGKKDWFAYGSKIILEKQQPDGRWQMHYDSPVDTAFALLFLNRSDLVDELTNSLHSYLEIPLASPLAAPVAAPRGHERRSDMPRGHEMRQERD
jgi:hypothetical protein